MIQNNVIRSDDPQAVEKLQAKLDKLTKHKCVAENKRRFVDKTFHSLDILDVLVYK